MTAAMPVGSGDWLGHTAAMNKSLNIKSAGLTRRRSYGEEAICKTNRAHRKCRNHRKRQTNWKIRTAQAGTLGQLVNSRCAFFKSCSLSASNLTCGRLIVPVILTLTRDNPARLNFSLASDSKAANTSLSLNRLIMCGVVRWPNEKS